MKILAASDFHGDARLAEKLAQRAQDEKVDLVALAGDLSHAGSEPVGLIGPFVKRGIKVVMIPGNHDHQHDHDMLCEIYDTKNLHGYGMKIGDVGIFGCGAATNVGPVNTITEEELFEMLEKAHKEMGSVKKKIMLTHMHPSSSIMEKFSKFVPPSTGVKKAIDKFKPDIVICGHVHEAEGIEDKIGNTKIINVGKKGWVFDI